MHPEHQTQNTHAESAKQPESGGLSMSPPKFSLSAAPSPPADGSPIQAKTEGGGMVAIPSQFQASHDVGCGCDNCSALQMKPKDPAPVQMAGGGDDKTNTAAETATVEPTYKGKDFTTSRAAQVLGQGADQYGIPEFTALQTEIGKNYAVTKAVIPNGSIVRLIGTATSTEGNKTKEVAQVQVVSVPKGQSETHVGQTYWTTRTNVSAAAGQDGNYSITQAAANIRSAPTSVMGTQTIPAGTKIQVTDTRGISEFPPELRDKNNAARNSYHANRYMRLYLSATWTDAQGVARSGWISANDVTGGFANEVLGTQPIPAGNVVDNAPNHKTIGTSKAPLLSLGGMVYDYKKVAGKKVAIKNGTYVQILKKSADGKYAQVSSEDGTVVGEWTSIGNLNMSKPKKVGEGDAGINFYPINNNEAYVRTEQQGFAETGTSLSRGDFVETYATNNGKLEVAKVTKVGDKYEPAKDKYWMDPAHLTDGWSTDLYGTNAAWGVIEIGGVRMAKYRGQKEFVNLGGSGGKMKQVSVEAYPNLIRMVTDAKANVGADSKPAPIGIEINSCFRTYFSQKYFDDNENNAGFNDAASPGTSDHQDSNAFDLNNLQSSAVYTWLKNNAWKYDIVQNVHKSNEKHHWAYLPGQGVEGQYTTWGTKSNQSW